MTLSKQELIDRVKEMNKIFTEVFDNWDKYDTNTNDIIQKQVSTGINKAYGQVLGFKFEYDNTLRVTQDKKRHVIPQFYADVTVGLFGNELFAKSVEHKSVTSSEKAAVNAQIVSAIGQLGAQKWQEVKHDSRKEDVRIVDIRIVGENPWPMTPTKYKNGASLSDIYKEAMQELKAIIIDSTTKPEVQNLHDWLTEGASHKLVEPLSKRGNLNPNPNSTRPFHEVKKVVKKIRCLTIKIRYQPGYPITDKLKPPPHTNRLSELVFQAYANPKKKADVILMQVKTKLEFFLNGKSIVERYWP